MFAIFRKEINGFFSSLTGYIVIIVFLVVNSLFMWVFPGELNILDSGYAGIDTLFFISPWIFMFLVPAVTMRMIAEEKRLGTIELIFSKPVTNVANFGRALILPAAVSNAAAPVLVTLAAGTASVLKTGGCLFPA